MEISYKHSVSGDLVVYSKKKLLTFNTLQGRTSKHFTNTRGLYVNTTSTEKTLPLFSWLSLSYTWCSKENYTPLPCFNSWVFTGSLVWKRIKMNQKLCETSNQALKKWCWQNNPAHSHPLLHMLFYFHFCFQRKLGRNTEKSTQHSEPN